MSESRIDGRTREGRALRETRAEGIARERRRRTDNLGVRMRTAVSGEKDPNFAYRWVNESKLHDRTINDDWDIVTRSGDGFTAENATAEQMGEAVTIIANSPHDGKDAERAFLCRKPKEFYEEDRRAKQRQLEEMDEAIRKGRFNGSEGELSGEKFYNPDNRRNEVS